MTQLALSAACRGLAGRRRRRLAYHGRPVGIPTISALTKVGNPTSHLRESRLMTKPSPERVARVEALKALTRTPLTSAEKALYDSQRAAEMARAEARRNPPAELELPLGAPDNGR